MDSIFQPTESTTVASKNLSFFLPIMIQPLTVPCQRSVTHFAAFKSPAQLTAPLVFSLFILLRHFFYPTQTDDERIVTIDIRLFSAKYSDF